MGDVAVGLLVDAPVRTDADTETGTDTRAKGNRRPHRPMRVRPTRKRWQFWRSPPDQPAWARPTLLLVAALAALSYSWGMGHAQLETFYAGAVRSMSESWHNFFFGAFDPWGTVSVDKLPGAFWVQALSVRLFGPNVAAMALPQAIEGTLTVLVLFRAVRRVGGAGAGLVAALVLAATPVTVLLNRGNISDSLLVLLLVLAADAATSAFLSGRLWSLVRAGVWVGLAFQTKMLQAWIVLPALYLAYLVAAPIASVSRRVGHIALSAAVVLAVSLSWMCVVSLVPAHERPYVDGSCNDSVFSQVFLYNGADRVSGHTLDQPGCTPPPVSVTTAQTTTGGAKTVALEKGPDRFLAGMLGRDAAWFFPPALVALVVLFLARRKEPPTDPWRAAALLWGVWMVFTWAFFASSRFLNAYYLAALVPPMAALCGLGLAMAWKRRASPVVPIVMMATVAGGVLYALALVPANAGLRPAIFATSILAALAAVTTLFRSLSGGDPVLGSRADRLRRRGLALSALALLLGAAWASATAVASELGPFDTPYQPAAQTTAEQSGWGRTIASWPAQVERTAAVPASRSVETVETSAQAGIDVLATGHEYLPVGGFTGQVPSTPLRQFVRDVGDRRVQLVLVSVQPRSRNPDLVWTVSHCSAGSRVKGGTVTYRQYLCGPTDAAGSP